MRLVDFLKTINPETGKPWRQSQFARKLGVCRATVSFWVRGLRGYSPYMAKKIERLSKGTVTLAELYADVR